MVANEKFVDASRQFQMNDVTTKQIRKIEKLLSRLDEADREGEQMKSTCAAGHYLLQWVKAVTLHFHAVSGAA